MAKIIQTIKNNEELTDELLKEIASMNDDQLDILIEMLGN